MANSREPGIKPRKGMSPGPPGASSSCLALSTHRRQSARQMPSMSSSI